MEDDGIKKKKNFFESTVGIISGITALIVALTGLFAAVNNFTCNKGSKELAENKGMAAKSITSAKETKGITDSADIAKFGLHPNYTSPFNLNPNPPYFNLIFRSYLLDTSLSFKYNRSISLEELKNSLLNFFDLDERLRERIIAKNGHLPVFKLDWKLSINSMIIDDTTGVLERVKDNDVVSLSYQIISERVFMDSASKMKVESKTKL